MLKHVFILAVSLFAALTIQAQKVWTLEDCINYAEENSIDVQKQALTTDKSRLDLQEGKWAFVPSISASTNYTASTGRVLDPTTYQFVQTSLTGNSSSSISGDIALFEGGKKIHALKRAKLSLRASLLKEESVRYNLKLNVIAAYMDVLCAEENIRIAEQSASLVEAQYERSKIRLEAGDITESDVLQLRSQLYSAQNDVSSARQSAKMALLSLCNLLEIEDYESFKVAEPAMDELTTELLDMDAAIEKHPDYQASLLNESLAHQDIKIAKASLYPTLSLSAGYGSSFSDARQKAIPNPDGTITYEAYPFFQQYADNRSVYVSVGLRIPIITGLSARNSVKRAKIAASEAECETLSIRKLLRKNILQAQIDCEAARDKYLRAREEVRYAEEAQRQIEEKYNLGETDCLAWSAALAELAKAKYSESEAKYTCLLKAEILKSY